MKRQTREEQKNKKQLTRERQRQRKTSAEGIPLTMTDEKIKSLLAAKKWAAAETAMKARLKRKPDDHFLWANLSGAVYMLGRYKDALTAAERSLKLAPSCSLAIWEQAEALSRLERYEDAIRAYRRITSRGVEGVMRDLHHEGRAWTKTLVCDSLFRLSCAYLLLGRRKSALRAAEAALSMRGHGLKSLYPISDIHEVLDILRNNKKV